MNSISDEVISVEEAKAALRCMRLGGFDETQALESIDSLVERIRKISTATLVDEIIENRLSENQRIFVQEYWFSGKSTAQIARERGMSQANVYRTLGRANDTITELLTPLIKYYRDLPDVQVAPLFLEQIMGICSARRSKGENIGAQLKKIRLINAVTSEQTARALCITVKKLESIENGKTEPTLELLERYSAVFGVRFNFEIVNGRRKYEWKKV